MFAMGALVYYVHKILVRTCVCQRVSNISFSEDFVNVLNEWSL